MTKSKFNINGDAESITIKKFSGGEVQVTVNRNFSNGYSIIHRLCVNAHIKDADGIIALMQLKSILDTDYPHMEKSLELPYVPYARQDRSMGDGDAFSLKVFCNLLNSLKFDIVYITDPHSDVTPALIDNVVVRHQHSQMHIKNIYDAVVSPDGGALKKIYKVSERFNLPVIKADKVRDIKTGNITSTEAHGNVTGLKLLIVDDIIDGGRSFTELAKVLKEKGASQVDLYITHGIFSKGINVLREHIDKIYCLYAWSENLSENTDSFVTDVYSF